MNNYMKTTHYFLIFIISTINASLCAMQPTLTTQVIVRVSNMMETQNAMVTFETSKLGLVLIEANQDFALAKLGEGRNNNVEEIIDQHQGIPTLNFLRKIHISTPLGVASLLGGGNSTMIQFFPYLGKETILINEAKRLRIIIDPTGYVSLVDNQA
jgi:hypothetical protein